MKRKVVVIALFMLWRQAHAGIPVVEAEQGGRPALSTNKAMPPAQAASAFVRPGVR